MFKHLHVKNEQYLKLNKALFGFTLGLQVIAFAARALLYEGAIIFRQILKNKQFVWVSRQEGT